MALVKMSRLTLIALDGDKQKIFDEIVKSGCVEISECEETEYCVKSDNKEQMDGLETDIRRLDFVMRIIGDAVDRVNGDKKGKDKLSLPKPAMSRPRYELTFEQFNDLSAIKDEIFAKADRLENLRDSIINANGEITRIDNEIRAEAVFLPLEQPVSHFRDTAHSFNAVGTLPSENFEELADAFAAEELASLEKLNEYDGETLVCAVCHKSREEFWNGLSKYGFRRAESLHPYTPSEKTDKLKAERALLEKQISGYTEEIISFIPDYDKFRLVSDRLNLSYKQLAADGGFAKTAKTFVMSAFVPSEKEEAVTEAIYSVTEDVIVAFAEIGEGEYAPTLARNNGFVSSFETVTNMYTPPSYHEPDPNPVMSVFYFLIFGLMTADIGYGAVLALGGLTLSFLIKQNTGMRQLAKLLGVCGFSTMLWGAIFGSFFSLDISLWFSGCPDWYPLLPSPVDFPIVTMIASLVLGIFHIMAGIACNAYKLAKRKDWAGMIFDALIWEVFFVGLIMLALKPGCDMIIGNGTLENVKQPQIIALQYAPDLTMAGLICMGVALAVVLFTGGRKNKGLFGKLKGGFGGIYGVINYFSDVVSYVRIFGLMLSGAVFGLIVNQIAGMLMSSAAGYIFAVVVLVIFHLFNLALAALGAYVHNARLQYVEFFGKFYEGDGELFVPFGSDLEYTLIRNGG